MVKGLTLKSVVKIFVWMSDRNYEECLTKKALVKIKGAGHGASYYENGEEYRKAVKNFLDNI